MAKIDKEMEKFSRKTLIILLSLMIFSMLVFLILSVKNVSAADWDNWLAYSNNNRIATITNALNFGSTIAQAELITPRINYVIPGKNRRVMIFEVENYGDVYINALKEMQIKNMRIGKTELKSFHYEYAVYGDVVVDDYSVVCFQAVNGTNECENKKTGSHIEKQIIRWEKLNSKDIPKGKLTIALVTDVNRGDYYDGIPTLFGVKIDRWAVWTDGLNEGLEAYWMFDEAAGTEAKESVYGIENLTGLNTNSWTAQGIIESAYNTTGEANIRTNITANGTSSWKEMTFNFWINATSAWTGGMASLGYATDTRNGDWYLGEGATYQIDLLVVGLGVSGNRICYYNFASNFSHWAMFTLYVNTTDVRFYHNAVQVCQKIGGTSIGSWTGSNLTFFNNENFILAPGAGYGIDEAGIWNRSLSTAEITDLYNGGAGMQYIPPTTGEALQLEVNLSSPASGIVVNTPTQNFSANYSSSGGNLTNATMYVWNSTDLFNSSEIFEINGTFNTTDWETGGFSIGNYEWNAEACADNETDTLCSSATTNRTFSVGATLISTNYNEIAYETGNEDFAAEFAIIEGSEISLMQLVYNNTNYTITNYIIDGTNLTLKRNIDIPLNPSYYENSTKEFFFRFTYGGGTLQESETNEQTISYINLQICNSTYPDEALNFTFKDEIANAILNAEENITSMEVIFNYWIGLGETYKNYSYSNLSNAIPSTTFCIFPSEATIKTNMNMDYDAVSYAPRTYLFRNASITNSSTLINLPLLSDDLAVKFFISLKKGTNLFTNGIVTISKFFTGEGEYQTIGIRKSDDSGEFIEYMELDKEYRFVIVRDGINYGIINKQVTCQAAPCTFTLQLEDVSYDAWGSFFDYFAGNVQYTLVYNDTTGNVTYTFTDLTGLANYFRLEVYQLRTNESSIIVCNQTSYTSSGTIICDVSEYEGQFKANAYVSRSPELFVSFINFLRDISLRIKETLGLNGILISLFLIVTIALVGAWNPAVGVALTAFSIFIMAILGFAAFSYTTVIAIMVIAIILIIKMRT